MCPEGVHEAIMQGCFERFEGPGVRFEGCFERFAGPEMRFDGCFERFARFQGVQVAKPIT